MNYGRAFEAIFSGFIKPASSASIRVFKHGTTDCESIAQNKDRARKGRSSRVVERLTEDALTHRQAERLGAKRHPAIVNGISSGARYLC